MLSDIYAERIEEGDEKMLDVIASSGIYAYLIIALLCILIARYAIPRITRIPFKMIRFILIVGVIIFAAYMYVSN